MKISKEQILCVAAGLLLSIASFSQKKEFLIEKDDGTYGIERPDFGQDKRDYEIYYETGDGKEKINVTVSPRKYTEEEAAKLFEAMLDPVIKAMLSGNPSITGVTENLSFIKFLDGYPGISISWKSDDPIHIGMGGEIQNDDVTDPVAATVKVTFSAGSFNKSYEIPILICAKEAGQSVEKEEGIEELLEKADIETDSERFFNLPSTMKGRKLRYSEPFDASPVVLFVMGILAAFLLKLKPIEDERKRKKERENELLLDYSDIVSKLIVYIGAGLTIRNAWEKLAMEHGEEGRAVYREISAAAAELKNGESENRVYLRFAKRCGLRCYTRLASLLDQNSRTGDEALLNALELEMDEAFEQRKNTARRLGEEAGTKLILPLMMLLITVLVMVATPALFTLT